MPAASKVMQDDSNIHTTAWGRHMSSSKQTPVHACVCARACVRLSLTLHSLDQWLVQQPLHDVTDVTWQWVACRQVHC
jgi:hypothetical protein